MSWVVVAPESRSTRWLGNGRRWISTVADAARFESFAAAARAAACAPTLATLPYPMPDPVE